MIKLNLKVNSLPSGQIHLSGVLSVWPNGRTRSVQMSGGCDAQGPARWSNILSAFVFYLNMPPFELYIMGKVGREPLCQLFKVLTCKIFIYY